MNIRVEVRFVNTTNPKSKLRARGNIILNESFLVRNVRLIEKKNKEMYLSMPSVKSFDEAWENTCHPLTPEFRNELEAAFVKAFNEHLKALQA